MGTAIPTALRAPAPRVEPALPKTLLTAPAPSPVVEAPLGAGASCLSLILPPLSAASSLTAAMILPHRASGNLSPLLPETSEPHSNTLPSQALERSHMDSDGTTVYDLGRRVSISGGLHGCRVAVQGENQKGQNPTRTEFGYILTAIKENKKRFYKFIGNKKEG